MKNRKKPEQMFYDGHTKIMFRKFMKGVRFIYMKNGLIKNPEFD